MRKRSNWAPCTSSAALAEGSIRRYSSNVPAPGGDLPLNKKADMLALPLRVFIHLDARSQGVHVRRWCRACPPLEVRLHCTSHADVQHHGFNVAKAPRAVPATGGDHPADGDNELFPSSGCRLSCAPTCYAGQLPPDGWVKTEPPGTHHDTEIAHT